jgi:beta-lactamase superfamily II metal-dependent hydrolase
VARASTLPATTYDDNLGGNDPETEIAFVNVGQGDCTIAADLRAREALIIDCPAWGVNAAISVLERLRVRVTTIFVTHFDQDHFSGIPALVRRFGPVVLYSNPETLLPDDKRYPRYRSALAAFADLEDLGLATNKSADRWMTERVGRVCWTLLAPQRTDVLRAMGASRPSRNQASSVVRLDTGPASAIIGGDAPGRVWASIVGGFPQPLVTADVLRTPHHGADLAPAAGALDVAALLTAVRPSHVVNSVGSTNRYVHPSVGAIHESKGPMPVRVARVLCTQVTPLCLGASTAADRDAYLDSHAARQTSTLGDCAGTIQLETAGNLWRVVPRESAHALKVDSWATPHCRPRCLPHNSDPGRLSPC